MPDPETKPVQSEEFAHNGAAVVYLPDVKKWGVYDVHNHLHGYRRSLDAAREFAASLPGAPIVPEPPPPIHRSPRALPLPAEESEIEVVPADQRPDFFEMGGDMSPWRKRNVGRASER